MYFWACLMLILGIRAAKQQEDSFFAFSTGEMQRVRIETVQEKIESLCCILKRHMGFSDEKKK